MNDNDNKALLIRVDRVAIASNPLTAIAEKEIFSDHSS